MDFLKGIRCFLFCLFLGGFFYSQTLIAEAANTSLYLFPSGGTYYVGSIFKIEIALNSSDDLINAAEAYLTFNPNELEVLNVSTASSIFNLWTNGPSFSNDEGVINFGGGVPAGFLGSNGTIIEISFRAKKVSTSKIIFSSGLVLAADGQGTNILSSMNGGNYSIMAKASVPLPEEIPPEMEYQPSLMPDGTPLAPVISSPTHPDPNTWYSNSSPEFNWQAPKGIVGIRVLLNKSPANSPTEDYSPDSSQYLSSELEDGAWYFHIRFANEAGWGAILHRKILIDSTPPEPFDVLIDNTEDPINPRPLICANAIDPLSGIASYSIQIGEGIKEIIPIDQFSDNCYRTELQDIGERTVIIEAVDNANNKTPSLGLLAIAPLEPPIITEFPKTISVGNTLVIKGTSFYPRATVKIFLLEKDAERAIIRGVPTDNNGDWTLIYPEALEKGFYQVWTEIVDNRGAKSYPTERIELSVSLPPFLQFGRMIIDYLTVFITLSALIILLVLMIAFILSKFRRKYSGARKEAIDARSKIRESFFHLRQQFKDQIRYLAGKKGLAKNERNIKIKLEEALDLHEKVIEKEIKDIEKELDSH